MIHSAQPAGLRASAPSLFDRVLETELRYFEIGARTEQLGGAVLAWTPDFVQAPAASVVQRVDPEAVLGRGPGWLAEVESRLAGHGIRFARIYLTVRHPQVDSLLREAGYACREELLFTDNLPDPSPLLNFRMVRTDEDWARKLEFHHQAPQSPDGHDTRAADLVGLERHKCAHGMEAFLGEIDGRIVGVVGALWGDGIVRVKNLLVHPDHRRRSVGSALLSHIAALGRERDLREQCVLALEGGAGEKLYRSLGMQQPGSQFEWSRRLDGL